MSKKLHRPEHEHGTEESYVVGFILSLALTVVPYLLVVTKSLSGTILLAVILTTAFLQMIIQIVFFLHLGRGPKPFYNIVFFVSTVGIIVVVVGGSVFIMNHLHYNMTPGEASKQLAESEGIYQVEGKKTGACKKVNTNHRVTIINDVAIPDRIQAQLCDTLTFINQDSVEREITFGPHPKHGTYAGESELAVRKGRNKTITLNQLGTYYFHDHLQPKAAGSFTVAR